MKTFRRNIRAAGALILVCFLGLGGWFGYTVYTQGTRWVGSKYNPRLALAKNKVDMGQVLDRNGAALAYTDEEGARRYASSELVRRAVSQTVGDTLSMSGTGVQTFHAGTLLGFSGSIIDRTWQLVSGSDATGDNIRLTVDADLSAYLSGEFPSGLSGAVVALNYRTGEVLCMVSKPDYDPQTLTLSTIDTEGSAYLNRCLQGLYAPGSVMKIVTLASALDNLPDITARALNCAGLAAFGKFDIRCAGGATHGDMNLKQAFAKSCNIAFAGLTVELGADRLRATAEKMGFNDNFSFQDVVLYESVFPDDMTDPGELAWSGVGQGKVLVTPMHMCLIAASVANGGVMPQPRLILQITGSTGIPRLYTPPVDYGRVLSAETARTVGNYMRAVVENGTGAAAAIDGYAVCGKTGSAETSDDKTKKTNAWFVGYIDSDSAPYAVAVVIEEGGSGGDAAAKLAAKAFTYLTR